MYVRGINSRRRAGRVLVATLSAVVIAIWIQGCGTKTESPGGEETAVPPDYPTLPWPPPKPTSRFPIPQKLVMKRSSDSLGVAFNAITTACKAAELDWSVYAIDSTGFAVVSELDSIDEKGAPKRGPSGSHAGSTHWGPGDIFTSILRRLFAAAPGRYRLIILAVTARPMKFSADTLSRSGATDLLMGGEDYLPEALLAFKPGTGARCEALVYEYWRPSEVDTASWVDNRDSKIKPIDHLANSGLWSKGVLKQ